MTRISTHGKRLGRPPMLTPEQKEASRIAQNKKRSARSLAKRTAARAARALAEGRVPGKAGQPTPFTPEQQKANRRAWERAHRQANLAESRSSEAEWQRQRRAEKAVADGRPPGVVGRVAELTAEQRLKRSRASSLRYWRENPEKRPVMARAYYEANKDAAMAKSRNRRARLRACVGEHTAAEITALRVLQKGFCGFCLSPLGHDTPHVDHFLPLALGGANDIDNLSLMHSECNLRKGALHPAAFGLTAPLRFALERTAS